MQALKSRQPLAIGDAYAETRAQNGAAFLNAFARMDQITARLVGTNVGVALSPLRRAAAGPPCNLRANPPWAGGAVSLRVSKFAGEGETCRQPRCQ